MTDDCACVYDYDDGEATDFLTVTSSKARKPHTCSECRRPIASGEFYERASGKCDGRMFTNKTCAVCEEIRDVLFCDGYTYGRVWSSIREFWNEGGSPIGCIRKLETVAAKEFLQSRYQAFLELR